MVQAFCSLGLPQSIQKHVRVKQQQRGYDDATFVESFVILHAAGGECTVGEYYYRGDSACHESGLVNGLRDEQRPGGPRGRIGFAISARMSAPLHAALQALPETAWEPYGDPHPAETRECADVPFAPSEKTEKKDSQPLRYVAMRIRKQQGELFEEGSAVRHFAVLSNRWELKAARWLEWHREKAGTIELVHDVIKNDLGGGVLPSKYFGAKAAWLRLTVIAHNVLGAPKRLALPAELLTARPQRLRFLIFHTPGRLVHHARNLLLRLATAAEWTAAYREGLRVLLVTPAKGHSYQRIGKPPSRIPVQLSSSPAPQNIGWPPAAYSGRSCTAHSVEWSFLNADSRLTHSESQRLLRYRRIAGPIRRGCQANGGVGFHRRQR